MSREAGAGSNPAPATTVLTDTASVAQPEEHRASNPGAEVGFLSEALDSHGPAAGGQRVRPLSVW